MKKILMDGNTATAKIAYYLSEVAAIYPITPSSAMAESCDDWQQNGKLNIFGEKLKIIEMQSEAGASGAMHGSLIGGALSTTFTASQGLLLMIPNMYKMSGELLPGVIHCSARTIATHALSIFGDHSDVMATRQTGFCMLASNNPQEAHDMALIAHLSSLKSSLPFIHFFDGFRTSHEINSVNEIDENSIKSLFPYDSYNSFAKRATSPDCPIQKGTAQNPDIFFQNREASNTYYNAVSDIVENYMTQLYKKTKRKYKLFDYVGAKDAEYVVISMGSSCDCIEQTILKLNAAGKKYGLIKVRLYRPFSIKHFITSIPNTVKAIAVLDRTKESGSNGEPLKLDVINALYSSKKDILVCGGRYGLGGKEFNPAMAKAVFENLETRFPKDNFTVGIDDDVTKLSLNIKPFEIENDDISCKFYGLGSDGTVSANKNTVKIVAEDTSYYAQGYFEYDSKKSGSITISHLRFSKKPIKAPYSVTNADIIACHNQSFLKKFDMLSDIKENGTFILNTTAENKEELEKILPANYKRIIAKKHITFYTINALDLARKIGLNSKINTIMQSCFFYVITCIPFAKAKAQMKNGVVKSYSKAGELVVKQNFEAIEKAPKHLSLFEVPSNWKSATDEKEKEIDDKYYNEYVKPIILRQGNDLPVSRFNADGSVPTNTSKLEKRAIASQCPQWISENCIQCNQCSFVCPHSAIKPVLVSKQTKLPADFNTIKAQNADDYQFRIQVSPLDCTGCGICAQVCPAKEKALKMIDADKAIESEQKNFEFSTTLPIIKNVYDKYTLKGSQFAKSYFEFSGACAGCGETPYIKAATQLFGDRMIIANATGCSSIYGGSSPTCPYAKDDDNKGPSWSNSLFEDNAEYGLGIKIACDTDKQKFVTRLDGLKNISSKLKQLIAQWKEIPHNNFEEQKAKKVEIQNQLSKEIISEDTDYLKNNLDNFVDKSVWIFGGDGWAYDIGFGGLDHVIASGQNVNILVLDTEVYSNTGGQSSKATPMGAIAKFASGGKKNNKKPLAQIAMTYKNVYVAKVNMGANKNQLIKALIEAQNYDGPSIVIAYSSCTNHGINMTNSQDQQRLATECGYWNIFRYNPALKSQGKNPFILDNKTPNFEKFFDYLMTEKRYSQLYAKDKETASKMFEEAKNNAIENYEILRKLSEN